MNPRLNIEITDTSDSEAVGLRVTASNGLFAATVDLWEGRSAIVRLADGIRGFPVTSSDRREISWGSADGDGIRLILSVVSAAPQIRVEAHSRSRETAAFDCAIEATAIDGFVAALEAMPLEDGAITQLALSA